MASLAETSDVEGLWREFDDTDRALATRLLTFASAIVRRQFRDIDARIASGNIEATLVRDAVAMMVRRAMETPDGVRRRDDGTVSNRIEDITAFDRLALTAMETELLEPIQIGALPAIGTMKTTPSLDYTSPHWFRPGWPC